MKYIYLIITILSVGSLLAQNSRFAVNPNPNSVKFIADGITDHNGHGRVRNNTNGLIQVYWTREILQIPPEWTTLVCDANYCYSPDRGICPENNPNNIKPNDSTILDVHVSDNGVDGEAHIVMWVYEKDDTTHKVKVDYLFNKVISNNDVKNIEIKMYPNPAYNSFSVDFNQGLTRIDLFSILGKKMNSYKALQGRSYDISQLQDGLYFVKLIGHNNQMLKTIRLQKKSLKP